MNHDQVIKTTNRLAVYAIIALIYWVFTFLIITVFGMRIFRERMTEMFLMSLLGIFAVLGGVIILNVMSNLSKISAAVAPTSAPALETSRRKGWLRVMMLVSFPMIAAILFIGNELSVQKKELLLISAAEELISENQSTLAVLADYKFSREYVKEAQHTLNFLNKIDKYFPEVMIIVPDNIDGHEVFLGFGGRQYSYSKLDEIDQTEFILSTSQIERDYLGKVFTGNETDYRFDERDGNYQLFYPVSIGDRKIVLYFADFQRYGKFGI